MTSCRGGPAAEPVAAPEPLRTWKMTAELRAWRRQSRPGSGARRQLRGLSRDSWPCYRNLRQCLASVPERQGGGDHSFPLGSDPRDRHLWRRLVVQNLGL